MEQAAGCPVVASWVVRGVGGEGELGNIVRKGGFGVAVWGLFRAASMTHQSSHNNSAA